MNIIDIFSQHIFLLIHSNCHINLMIFYRIWLIKLSYLVTFQVPIAQPSSREIVVQKDATFVCTLLFCNN